MLAGLVRRGEDFDAAEDALQEALLEALRAWPEHPPRDPHAWLATVATRRLVVVLRVLYLVYTAGHGRRVDLAGEAIRLARQLTLATEVSRPVGPGRRTARAGERPGIRHVAFAVDDIDAVAVRLRARGGELVGEVER